MKQQEPDDAYREIQNMEDAGGWRAVFVEKHEQGFPYLAEEPLVGWGHVAVHGVYIEEKADVVLDIEISGLVAREEVEEANMSPNFMGYVGPGEDRNVYLDEMHEKIVTMETSENIEEPEVESESP